MAAEREGGVREGVRERGREGGRCVVFFSHGLVSSASGPAGAGLVLLLILEAIHPFTDFTAYFCCITVCADLREKIKASTLGSHCMLVMYNRHELIKLFLL